MISYVEGLDIGTGFYEDEIQEEILKLKLKQDKKYIRYIKNIVFADIFLIILLLLISRFISNFLLSRLR